MAKASVFVRAPYNYDMGAVSDETGLLCEDVSLTKQSFAEECDINTIVRNFGLTGKLPDNYSPPQYGDFEGIFDYQSALNSVIAAERSFMELPAHIRARFHNNPQALLEFVSNEDNLEEAVKLGLALERPAPLADAGGPVAQATGAAGPGGAPSGAGGGAAP